MIRIDFVKMQGAGNDYVLVDGYRQALGIDDCAAIAAAIADRHFGVGGDGLILLTPSAAAACRMVMWNSDGSRGAMCGNGLRCLAKLAWDRGVVREHVFDVETDAGRRRVELTFDADGRADGAVVAMPGTRIDPSPAHVDLGALGRWEYLRGDAGNPHAVVFVADPERAPVADVGRAFQSAAAFPDGVNVEFVAVADEHTIVQRTFERGAGETLACGTGATVAALAAFSTRRVRAPEVTVRLRGGELRIRCGVDPPEMIGPATVVFEGSITLP